MVSISWSSMTLYTLVWNDLRYLVDWQYHSGFTTYLGYSHRFDLWYIISYWHYHEFSVLLVIGFHLESQLFHLLLYVECSHLSHQSSIACFQVLILLKLFWATIVSVHLRVVSILIDPLQGLAIHSLTLRSIYMFAHIYFLHQLFSIELYSWIVQFYPFQLETSWYHWDSQY